MLLKQSVAYFVLSLLVVLCAKYIHLGIVYLDMIYTYLNVLIVPYIAGAWLRNVLIMISLPLILTAIPAIIYRLIKKANMPYFLESVWILWLVFVLSNVLIQ
jgi:hypothetical protein